LYFDLTIKIRKGYVGKSAVVYIKRPV